MFTGIVEAIGKITAVEKNIFTIEHPFKEPFALGDSVSLSGMCSTVIRSDKKHFSVEIMEESRSRTIFGSVGVGENINLERAAQIGARNSGHFVLGHIDELGVVLQRKSIADFECFRIGIATENRKLVVPKGSITLDGISLTISDLSPMNTGKNSWFEVSIISHTLGETTLREKTVGTSVNLEYDILGKYILNQNAEEKA
jgi:riboflavin synthase